MTDQTLQTEFEFTLPRGYVDGEGTLHREGRMRLATAADEIQPLSEPHVQSNSSYLTIVLLSRVVTELGTLETVDIDVVENLFVADLEYLQAMYERVNNRGRNAVTTTCPDCGETFDVDATSGVSLADPPAGSAADEAAPIGTTDDGEPIEGDAVGATDDADLESPSEVEAGNANE
ncbi:hypothetical protein Halru_2688 [Halovivax ruber XH-70]|uniref:Phage tail assembly protein n=1 Tax=Halovivax ruber (strain DSM 18193 / JCM 13892 / XH-70) TaxID=797302 RepID=L0IEK1_HALRX|nr:hypothetical protein [Halovivax ruber]AGB17263.1 hypothetical protein Halru_2688 [Halovivax ruber XH-70]